MDTAPLMRVSLFDLGEDARIFVWTYHHLILDGWSLPRVFQELFTCYESFLEDRGAKSRPPPSPSGLYRLVTQRDLAAGRTLLAREPGWLPIHHTLPITASGNRGDTHDRDSYLISSLEFSDQESLALNQLAARLHITLNILVQGAWALL